MEKTRCKCGGTIQEDKCFIENFLVHCMKCQQCGEILFTPHQTKELIRLREANKEIQGERKIVKIGSSIAALLPKKVERYGIKEGLIETIRILSTNSLEIKFKKEII